MSIYDQFYVDIEQALGTQRLDSDLFEQLAVELVSSKGFGASLVSGGADNGYDFELLDASAEPGPGIVTTSDRVTRNLKRNLDRNRETCPRAARKTYVVTSSVLTPRKRENLKKAAAERGYTYLGASDRHDVTRYIYANPHWARDLLGLTGQPSALSAVPRTSRPLLDIPIVGRESELDRIRRLNRNMLLVGSPGSGKTSLLAHIVAAGMGSFLVSTDMAAVANAIRHQRPRVIIVDDLEDIYGVTRELVRLQKEIGADFKIVVTDWEENPEIQQVLGLTDADVLKLGQLTRDEIVMVVQSVGVGGPRDLIREIVNQAEGVPGLAVTLAQAALAGDYQALFDGNRLGSLMESTVNRLLGNPMEGHRAILALGSIALAGDAGLTLEETADFVGISKTDLQGQFIRLTSGGIIRSNSQRISLRPRSLRRYMIRKAFFGPTPADYTPLLSIVPNAGQAARELVLAARAGAVIPELLKTVLRTGDRLAARYFVGSGEREALQFLEAAPDQAVHVAREALYSVPETVIPMLLELAVDDPRALHNTPEQPLRLISDWANSAIPGRGEVVARKRIVITSALKWADRSNNFKTAIRLLAEVIRADFERNEMDPGSGMAVHLIRGMLTRREVEQLGSIWGEIKKAIAQSSDIPWPPLISMCGRLIHPHVGNSSSDSLMASRCLAESFIKDLGGLAAEHPGVLDQLNRLLKRLGQEELYEIPSDFAILFGERDRTDWRREEKERSRQIKQLARTWADGHPDEFAARLKWLQNEAQLAGTSGRDHVLYLCRLIAEGVNDASRWLSALTNAEMPSIWILPFLERATETEKDGWESVVLSVMKDPRFEWAAINITLRAAMLSDEMWAVLSPKLSRHRELIETLCLRGEVSLGTLRRLLQHDSAKVRHATAVGMWAANDGRTIPEEIDQEWEEAIVAIDDNEYWLGEILAENPTIADRWLRERMKNDDWLALSSEKIVEAACRNLEDGQRIDLLSRLPNRFHEDEVAAALIGGSEIVYRKVLKDPSLRDHWKTPLQRPADKTWRWYAGIALEEGRTPREVTGASLLRSDAWCGQYSAYLQRQIDEFSVWLDDTDAMIQEVARQAIKWLSANRDRALLEERREAIEGLG